MPRTATKARKNSQSRRHLKPVPPPAPPAPIWTAELGYTCVGVRGADDCPFFHETPLDAAVCLFRWEALHPSAETGRRIALCEQRQRLDYTKEKVLRGDDNGDLGEAIWRLIETLVPNHMLLDGIYDARRIAIGLAAARGELATTSGFTCTTDKTETHRHSSCGYFHKTFLAAVECWASARLQHVKGEPWPDIVPATPVSQNRDPLVLNTPEAYVHDREDGHVRVTDALFAIIDVVTGSEHWDLDEELGKPGTEPTPPDYRALLSAVRGFSGTAPAKVPPRPPKAPSVPTVVHVPGFTCTTDDEHSSCGELHEDLRHAALCVARYAAGLGLGPRSRSIVLAAKTAAGVQLQRVPTHIRAAPDYLLGAVQLYMDAVAPGWLTEKNEDRPDWARVIAAMERDIGIVPKRTAAMWAA